MSHREMIPRTHSTDQPRSGCAWLPSDRTSSHIVRSPRPRSGDQRRCHLFYMLMSPARFGSNCACSDPRDRPSSPSPSLCQSCTTGGTVLSYRPSL